jgi:hypothetical protein
MAITVFAAINIKETFHRDMNFLEVEEMTP